MAIDPFDNTGMWASQKITQYLLFLVMKSKPFPKRLGLFTNEGIQNQQLWGHKYTLTIFPAFAIIAIMGR